MMNCALSTKSLLGIAHIMASLPLLANWKETVIFTTFIGIFLLRSSNWHVYTGFQSIIEQKMWPLNTIQLNVLKSLNTADVFTAQIRSTREGNVLTRVCLSVCLLFFCDSFQGREGIWRERGRERVYILSRSWVEEGTPCHALAQGRIDSVLILSWRIVCPVLVLPREQKGVPWLGDPPLPSPNHIWSRWEGEGGDGRYPEQVTVPLLIYVLSGWGEGKGEGWYLTRKKNPLPG